MTVQAIFRYPNPALKELCLPVTDFESEEFSHLVTDLLETVKAHRAQGLAANQIGGKLRVFVSRVDDGDYKVYVNPELELEGDLVRNIEGCLSFPGATELVERPEECTVKAQDENGEEFTFYTDDVESVAIQHETDHLDGVLMVDRLSRLTKRFFLKKIARYNKKFR